MGRPLWLRVLLTRCLWHPLAWPWEPAFILYGGVDRRPQTASPPSDRDDFGNVPPIPILWTLGEQGMSDGGVGIP